MYRLSDGLRSDIHKRSTPRSLRQNFSWTLAGNLVFGLYQWYLVASLAKLNGPESVGQYSLALAIIVPVQMFFNMQLRALQASDVGEKFAFSHYLTLRVITTVIVVVLIGSISLLWPASAESRLILLAVLATKAIESYSDVIYGAFQQKERMDISAKSRIIGSISSAFLFLITLAVFHDLILSLVAISVAQILTLVAYTIRILRSYEKIWNVNVALSADFRRLWSLAKYALPLGVAISIININGALPRWFLGYFKNSYEVGIYAGIYQMLIAGTIVVGALGQAVTPRLSRHVHNEDYESFFGLVDRLVWATLVAGIIATIGSRLVGGYFLQFLYSSEFSEHTTVLTVLAATSGFLFGGSFLGYALTAARIVQEQAAMFAVSTLVMAATLWVMVPSRGVEGAAWATLVTAIVQFALCWLVLRYRVGRRQMRVHSAY